MNLETPELFMQAFHKAEQSSHDTPLEFVPGRGSSTRDFHFMGMISTYVWWLFKVFFETYDVGQNWKKNIFPNFQGEPKHKSLKTHHRDIFFHRALEIQRYQKWWVGKKVCSFVHSLKLTNRHGKWTTILMV